MREIPGTGVVGLDSGAALRVDLLELPAARETLFGRTESEFESAFPVETDGPMSLTRVGASLSPCRGVVGFLVGFETISVTIPSVLFSNVAACYTKNS